MSEQSEFFSEAGGMDWEREVRGYNRQQVDNYVAWRAGQVRDLESRLSRSLAEIEHLRRELGDARASAARPPHEEISERVGQILKLAAEEARADRERGMSDANDTRAAATSEVDKLRAEAQHEVDRLKSEAQDRAERMLTAAQEQSDRAVATATAEAEQMTSSARANAEQTVREANEHAEKTVSTALAQAKQALDEATARASAIHDGAERRLNLLISRHTETVRRLAEIRDVVTGLVSGEDARGSLEDEVNRALGLHQQAAGGTQLAGGSAPAAISGTQPADSTAHHAVSGREGQRETSISGPRRVPRQVSAAERPQDALPAATPAESQREQQPEPEPELRHVREPDAEPELEPLPPVRGVATANGHEDDDPLTGPLPGQLGSRYPHRETAASRHSTDAAMQAAADMRHSAASGNGSTSPAEG